MKEQVSYNVGDIVHLRSGSPDLTVIRLCLAYLRRWSIEEATRAIKQCFSLENVRALTWTGIQRMVLLAHLAWAFLCKVARTIESKTHKLFGNSKMWFGETPEFFYYRLAESLAILLLSDRLKT